MKRVLSAMMLVVLAGVLGCKAEDGSSGTSPEGSATSSGAGLSGNTVTLPSGLKYEDLRVGDGPVAEVGSTVKMHYTGWLTDGTKFDSSLDRGEPYPLVLGGGTVIRGWEEGIRGMKVGGKRKLTIPPHLGYGAAGYGNAIPPNATLVFEVELVELQ